MQVSSNVTRITIITIHTFIIYTTGTGHFVLSHSQTGIIKSGSILTLVLHCNIMTVTEWHKMAHTNIIFNARITRYIIIAINR